MQNVKYLHLKTVMAEDPNSQDKTSQTCGGRTCVSTAKNLPYAINFNLEQVLCYKEWTEFIIAGKYSLRCRISRELNSAKNRSDVDISIEETVIFDKYIPPIVDPYSLNKRKLRTNIILNAIEYSFEETFTVALILYFKTNKHSQTKRSICYII